MRELTVGDVAVALVILFGAACASSDPHRPGSEPDMRNPGPDFGYIPNATGIVPPGRTYFETSGEFEYGPGREERGWSLPVLLRRGVAEDWELRLQTWLFQYARDDLGSESGAGPVELGFKHRLSRGGGRALEPAYGFEVELLLPASTGGRFDDGKVEPQAWVNVDHTTSVNGAFTWNAGLQTPVDDDGSQSLQGYLAWAYSHFVQTDVQLYATGSWNHPLPDSSSSAALLGAGLYWYFAPRMVLIAGYNAGLTSESVDGSLTMGVSFAF